MTKLDPALRVLVGAGMAALTCTVPATAAPRVLGHRDCEKCHKPAVSQWSETEPAALGGKAHFNTQKQLAAGNAAKYASAIGLASAADPNGACVACHATLVRGRVRSGVSCESCHGAASDYLDVHDKEPWPASYKKATSVGMQALHGSTSAIAGMCVDCHVTPDKRLANAGHPNGSGFDAGASLRKIVHWTAAFTPNQQVHASYDFAKVTADAKPLAGRRAAGGGGGGGGGGGSRRADPPASATADAAPPPPDKPFSWDDVKPLPDDYVPEANPPAPEAAPAPARRARPAAPSISEDQPFAFDAAPALAPAAEPEPAGPAPPAAQLAELRGRAAALLAALLAEGKTAAGSEAPPAPGEFKGPDGELLHIQDIVLYIALQTLRDQP